jgi:DHA2 family multidrug resistance protein
VRLFTASVLVFVISSWLCGLAPNIESLIFFRVLQGAVAGPMIPLSQTLLLASYPPALAGTAMAMWAMTTLVAPVMGPLLGGWITDNIAWPWIFYINIPVGLVAAALTWSIYRTRDPGPRRVPLDVVGLGLLMLWVGALQIMIDKGKELDWFGSPQIVVLALVAALGFVVFLAWELTESQPIVNLRLFARRNFLVGTVSLAVAYGLFFGNVVLLPLWLQQWMGYTATWAGLVMAPVGLLAIVLSPWVGKNVSRIDPRKLATVAFLGFAGVLWMRSQFNVQTTLTTILIPTVLQGAAMAFFFIPLQAIIFSGLKPEQLPSAAGLSNFARITAGAVGTSLFTTLWENRAAMHHAHLSEAVNAGNGASAGPGAACRGRPEPRASPCHAEPADRPAGLHDGRHRCLLPVGRAVRAAGGGGMVCQPAPRARGRHGGRRWGAHEGMSHPSRSQSRLVTSKNAHSALSLFRCRGTSFRKLLWRPAWRWPPEVRTGKSGKERLWEHSLSL